MVGPQIATHVQAHKPYEHIVSVSGGVDSGATLLKAVERGRSFVAMFADTGNEHEAVYEHIDYLEEKLGLVIHKVKANFDQRIAAKRIYVAEKWPAKGVPQDIINRALAVLHPTGNPFLDLCLLKTRFPSSKVRFCTEELKVIPMFRDIQKPLLAAGKAIISWQGVRADESRARATLSSWQRIGVPYGVALTDDEKIAADDWRIFAYRPLLSWKKSECFALYERHGLKPNPLYAMGFGRVGCMLCIMATKDEVRAGARHCLEHIERLAEWERLVSEASKRSCATFFAASDDPRLEEDEYPTLDRYGIHSRVEWSKTSRGGLQYDLERTIARDNAVADFNTSCTTWGACEAA